MTCEQCKFYLPYPIEPYDGVCRYDPHYEKRKKTSWCGKWKNVNAVKRNAKKLLESPEFQEFYEAYPKKTARGHANKAFCAIDQHHWGLIIERAKLFAQAVISDDRDMTYVMHPATWLNSESWKDKAEVKGDSKACIICGAAYAEGHKYAFENGKIVKGKYKCKECRKNK
jgi:quinol monooxygenase YgiN